MVYNKEDFDKQIMQLKPEGFEMLSSFGSTRFVKKEQNRVLTIAIGYNEYFPHSAVIKGVSADIYIYEIENTINPVLERYSITQRYGETTIFKSFRTLGGIDYCKLDIEINDEKTFNEVAEEVKKIISDGVLPFFERFKDLEKVNEQLATMSEEEISNFIVGIVGIKVPLIKKLTESKDYKIELLNRRKFYSDEVFKYPQYFKDHEKVFNDLFAEDLK